MTKEKMLVSACLLGINCKYDCTNNKNSKVLKLLETVDLIPVCPEQLGGLSSPRVPSEKMGSKVINEKGENVTPFFQKGAQEALKIAQMYSIKKAIFKQRSPSCGVGQIYDGTFSRKVIKGNGITTTLLQAHNLCVVSEEDLD